MELDFDDLDIPISDANLSHLTPPTSTSGSSGSTLRGLGSGGQAGLDMARKQGRSSTFDRDVDGDDEEDGVVGLETAGSGLGMMDWQSIDPGDFDFSTTFPSPTPQPHISIHTDLASINPHNSFALAGGLRRANGFAPGDHDEEEEADDGLVTPSTARPIFGSGSAVHHSAGSSGSGPSGSHSTSIGAGFGGVSGHASTGMDHPHSNQFHHANHLQQQQQPPPHGYPAAQQGTGNLTFSQSLGSGFSTPTGLHGFGGFGEGIETMGGGGSDFLVGGTTGTNGHHTFGIQMPSHPSTTGLGGFGGGTTGGHHHPGLSMSMINPSRLMDGTTAMNGSSMMFPLNGSDGSTGLGNPGDLHPQQLQTIVPSAALWPGSASLPNLGGLYQGHHQMGMVPQGTGGIKGSGKRPKKRARTSENTDDEDGSGAGVKGKQAGSAGGVEKAGVKEKGAGKKDGVASTPIATAAVEIKVEANDLDDDSDAEGSEGDDMDESREEGQFRSGMLGLRDGSVVDLSQDAPSPASSGVSLVSGFAGVHVGPDGFRQQMNDGMDGENALNGGQDGKDGKSRLKSFNGLNKKKKIPPPGGFKPWNTSPSSSHLPSGSACINPVTGEVELPPMDNLTKEEIRKVKNRASAQRSRTRKGELLGGLMDEVNRLRERLRDVTNGAEGGDGDDASMGAEEFLRKTHMARGGSVMSSSGSMGRDEEKEGMKMLIERLRGEVEKERKARESAEAQGWMWKNKHDQLLTNLTLGAGKTINPGLVSDPPASVRHAQSEEEDDVPTSPLGGLEAMDDVDEDELMELPLGGHLDAATIARSESVDDEDEGREVVQARKREKAIVKGSQRDSKGVLMMVVLFSFALFSLPPHIRTPGFNTSTAFHMSTNGNAEAAALFDKLLPYGSKASTSEMDEDGNDKSDALLAMADDAASKDVLAGRRQPVKGRKSLSFTLLKPIDEERGDDDMDKSEQRRKNGAASSTNGTVEDVLEKWLGLSLFDNGSSSTSNDESTGDVDKAASDSDAANQGIPGGWIVVKSSLTEDVEPKDDTRRFERASDMSSRGSTASPSTQGFKSLTAWDGTLIESMQLDEDVMSVSHGHDDFLQPGREDSTLTMPFAPDTRAKPNGPSPTLAPEFQEDPLAEEQRAQRAASVPNTVASDSGEKSSLTTGATAKPASTDRHRRQSLSVLGNGPVHGSIANGRRLGLGMTPTRSSPASSPSTPARVRSMPSSALMALDKTSSERYMKLELEVDFELELTCRGVRRTTRSVGTDDEEKGGQGGKGKGNSDGVSLVDREEVGRLLSSGFALGKEGGFLGLGL